MIFIKDKEEIRLRKVPLPMKKIFEDFDILDSIQTVFHDDQSTIPSQLCKYTAIPRTEMKQVVEDLIAETPVDVQKAVANYKFNEDLGIFNGREKVALAEFAKHLGYNGCDNYTTDQLLASIRAKGYFGSMAGVMRYVSNPNTIFYTDSIGNSVHKFATAHGLLHQLTPTVPVLAYSLPATIVEYLIEKKMLAYLVYPAASLHQTRHVLLRIATALSNSGFDYGRVKIMFGDKPLLVIELVDDAHVKEQLAKQETIATLGLVKLTSIMVSSIEFEKYILEIMLYESYERLRGKGCHNAYIVTMNDGKLSYRTTKVNIVWASPQPSSDDVEKAIYYTRKKLEDKDLIKYGDQKVAVEDVKPLTMDIDTYMQMIPGHYYAYKNNTFCSVAVRPFGLKYDDALKEVLYDIQLDPRAATYMVNKLKMVVPDDKVYRYCEHAVGHNEKFITTFYTKVEKIVLDKHAGHDKIKLFRCDADTELINKELLKKAKLERVAALRKKRNIPAPAPVVEEKKAEPVEEVDTDNEDVPVEVVADADEEGEVTEMDQLD